MLGHPSRLVFAAIGSILIAGCAQSVVVSNTVHDIGAYSPTDVGLAQSDGVTPVVVYGNPFADDRDGAGIVAAMQGRNPGPPLKFTNQQVQTRHGYRVVLAFGEIVNGWNYCGSDAPPNIVQPSGRTQIIAAWCLGPKQRAQTTASTGALQSPRDPQFRYVMAAILGELIPERDPNRLGRF